MITVELFSSAAYKSLQSTVIRGNYGSLSHLAAMAMRAAPATHSIKSAKLWEKTENLRMNISTSYAVNKFAHL